MKTVMRYRDTFSDKYLVVKTRVRTINNFTIIFHNNISAIKISVHRYFISAIPNKICRESLKTIDDGNAKFVDVILL